jgi:hypothetical protein
MPNLNLKGDMPDEISELPEVPEPEQMSPSSGGWIIKTLPLVTGGMIALLLAFYILNKTGIVHMWGNKKASSVMISVPVDSASQVLSDSVMMAQFRKDSIEALASPGKHADNQAVQTPAAEQKVNAPAVAAKKLSVSEIAKISAADAALKKAAAAEAAKKNAADLLVKKAAAAEAARKIAADEAAKKAANDEAARKIEAAEAARKRNITTVEVPGVPQHRDVSTVGDDNINKSRTGKAASKSVARSTEHAAAHRTVPLPEQAAQMQPVKKIAVRSSSVKPAAHREAVSSHIAAKPAEENGAPAQAVASEPHGSGKYTVQLSSWIDRSRAEVFGARFNDAGIPVFISTQGKIHRVCTGHFETKEAAIARAEKLVPMLEKPYDIIIVK